MLRPILLLRRCNFIAAFLFVRFGDYDRDGQNYRHQENGELDHLRSCKSSSGSAFF